MRGKHPRPSRRGRFRGSIPAHAGETPRASSPRRRPTVNPRSCGGNKRRRITQSMLEGQSPLMRGKLRPAIRSSCIERSIPAHAGETSPTLPSRALSRVNPRSCGGNMWVAALLIVALGQSPLMRGKLPGAVLSEMRGGSIPAHAGETAAHNRR